MKTLTKKNLDELALTMSVIPESERNEYWGMYDNDCFWRCVSYLSGTGISECAAASYALAFFSSIYGCAGTAHSNLSNNGAVMPAEYVIDYLKANNLNSGSGMTDRIVSLPGATSGGIGHVVILKGVNPDGTFAIYDPSDGPSGTYSTVNQVGHFVY